MITACIGYSGKVQNWFWWREGLESDDVVCAKLWCLCLYCAKWEGYFKQGEQRWWSSMMCLESHHCVMGLEHRVREGELRGGCAVLAETGRIGHESSQGSPWVSCEELLHCYMVHIPWRNAESRGHAVHLSFVSSTAEDSKEPLTGSGRERRNESQQVPTVDQLLPHTLLCLIFLIGTVVLVILFPLYQWHLKGQRT